MSVENPTAKEELASKLLRVLIEADVEFIVVGGVAAVAHGLERPVNDLDVLYRRSYENCRRIAETLRPVHPRPRGVSSDVEVPWNTSVIRSGYSFLMTTDLGDLDLIAELSGNGTFNRLKRKTVRLPALGVECDCLQLEPLIYHITQSGRPKDLELARQLGLLNRKPRLPDL